MKPYFFGLFCITLLSSCKKEDTTSESVLVGRWKMHTSAITSLAADACSYKTKPSDLYHISPVPDCRGDDVLEFSPENKLTVDYGTNKCNPLQPDRLTQNYQKTDSAIIINGKTYNIVLLNQDTLIIDYCQEINNQYPQLPPAGSSYAKIAEKFFRLR